MDWTYGRGQHLKLSDAAAKKYDATYADANFATGSYMSYEVQILQRWSACTPDHSLALDLGCGTGRDSFVLAKSFDQVFGYDFSQGMIDVAICNKLRRNADNVSFQVRDVEEGFMDLGPGCASFINSAFGMGSFVENVESFCREVRRLLKPGGIAIFSFYNKQALASRLRLQWRPALAARADSEEEIVHVEFDSINYDIAAKAYTQQQIWSKLAAYFEILDIKTFPTLCALLPQKLFVNQSVQTLCARVDELLTNNLKIGSGSYIVAAVRHSGR